MKKFGLLNFGGEQGEEVELKVSCVNVPYLPDVYLDGVRIAPQRSSGSDATYTFQLEKPVGESHEFVVQLPPTLSFPTAQYEIEVFGAGQPIEHRLIQPTGSRAATNLIFTFSTHGSGGGSKD